MKLQESGEMYLESILRLSKNHDLVRSVDLADYMGFSKPSVSRAVGLLRDGGYLSIDENGGLVLTASGEAVAKGIYERHVLLTKIFEDMGVSPKVAEEDACRIEHVLSDETFEALKKAHPADLSVLESME